MGRCDWVWLDGTFFNLYTLYCLYWDKVSVVKDCQMILIGHYSKAINFWIQILSMSTYLQGRMFRGNTYIYIHIYIYMAEEEETIYILVEAAINTFHPYSIFVALFDSSVSHLQFFWRSVDLKINNVFLPGWWDFSRNRFSVVVED